VSVQVEPQLVVKLGIDRGLGRDVAMPTTAR